MADLKRIFKRATASFNRKESTAQLATSDRSTAVQIKLTDDGNLLLEFFQDGISVARRELSKAIKWDD